MTKHIVFLSILFMGGYYFWTARPVYHGPGIVAPDEPRQKQAFGASPIKIDSYTLIPLAEYEIEARILSTKKYYVDKASEIAPFDFVVGWGKMSDERHLNKMLIRQSYRSWKWELARYPIPKEEMRRSIANMHLISSSEEISDMLASARVGQIINIKGFLVKISSDEGWELKSSLTRDDFGNNASEVVWIEKMELH